MIVLVRCDDRLIHGQCMTVVVKNNDIKEIIVVDDFTATNPILKKVFETAVPSTMKASVWTTKDAEGKIKEALTNDVRTLLLMKNPKVYLELLKMIPELPKELNVGPMTKRDGSIEIQHSIFLMPDEGAAVREAADMGAHIYFQQVPEQARIEWDTVKNKF